MLIARPETGPEARRRQDRYGTKQARSARSQKCKIWQNPAQEGKVRTIKKRELQIFIRDDPNACHLILPILRVFEKDF